ncbi:C40 family peptidase [Streptomyces bikiniensis]|uniref:C40 family peptidase n=1 Tax=Streptomyces bikiniensis TaxID=1896 RepID=UPI0004BF114F|nr:NlpC/P60 family protein [Streptomyces bikiniensis]
MLPAHPRSRHWRRVLAATASAAALAGVLAAPASAAPAPSTEATAAGVRQAVVNTAKAYLGTPYKLEYGWTCGTARVDCECLNRHAIWDGTKKATGHGLQLNYWLQGQINQGRRTDNPRPGDLIFWDTDPNDGIRYGGDLDHTGVYIGNGQAIDANAYHGRVKYDTVTLGGTERDPIYVDVLTPNGY